MGSFGGQHLIDGLHRLVHRPLHLLRREPDEPVHHLEPVFPYDLVVTIEEGELQPNRRIFGIKTISEGAEVFKVGGLTNQSAEPWIAEYPLLVSRDPEAPAAVAKVVGGDLANIKNLNCFIYVP